MSQKPRFLKCTENIERYMFAAAFCYQNDIIDVGCKHGLGTSIFGRYAKTIVATDIEDRFEYHGMIPFVPADFTADELPLILRREFDVAVCLEVIEHVKEPQKIIDNIATILRPGGTLILSTPCTDRELPADVHVTPYFTEEAFDALLSKDFELKVKTQSLGVSWLAVAEKH